MLSLDFTTVFFTISFIVFIALMKLFFFDPIRKVIDKREAFVEGNIEESKTTQTKIEQQIAEKDPKDLLSKAREEASQIVSASIDAAAKDKANLLNENRTKLKAEIEKNLQELESEQGKVREEINIHVKGIVEQTISKLMEEISTPSKETYQVQG